MGASTPNKRWSSAAEKIFFKIATAELSRNGSHQCPPFLGSSGAADFEIHCSMYYGVMCERGHLYKFRNAAFRKFPVVMILLMCLDHHIIQCERSGLGRGFGRHINPTNKKSAHFARQITLEFVHNNHFQIQTLMEVDKNDESTSTSGYWAPSSGDLAAG